VLAERPLLHVAVRCLSLAALVALGGTPVYVWVEPSWRPLVARLAGGLVLGVALLQLRRVVADRVEAGGVSALDAARDSRGPEPGLPHHFADLVSDVRTARRSRRYFETVLWPRLEALAGRPLAPPALRRGRGPSLAALRDVIAEIERRP
jgi:hypothetical protein